MVRFVGAGRLVHWGWFGSLAFSMVLKLERTRSRLRLGVSGGERDGPGDCIRRYGDAGLQRGHNPVKGFGQVEVLSFGHGPAAFPQPVFKVRVGDFLDLAFVAVEGLDLEIKRFRDV